MGELEGALIADHKTWKVTKSVHASSIIPKQILQIVSNVEQSNEEIESSSVSGILLKVKLNMFQKNFKRYLAWSQSIVWLENLYKINPLSSYSSSTFPRCKAIITDVLSLKPEAINYKEAQRKFILTQNSFWMTLRNPPSRWEARQSTNLV